MPANHSRRSSRRQFLGHVGAGTAALATLNATAWSVSARGASQGKLRLASVGVGGMGRSDLGQLSSHVNVEVVALCDVDANRLADAAKQHPTARTFADWREMLDTVSDDIDAVNVATPDHTHAPVSMSAVYLNKHVYCQKPLCHDVHEAGALTKEAAAQGVITQMGIQVHSDSRYRTAVKLIQDGAIGRVREAHSWSNKTWGHSGERPQPTEVPEYLSWDLWLGTAPERPYAKDHYHPSNWRRWLDFGCGTMGDMSIHILDPVYKALALTAPREIVSNSSAPPAESFSMKNQVIYRIPASKYTTDDFVLTWSDGGIFPDHSDWPVSKLPGQGSMFVGEKGYMLLPHVGSPQLLPAAEFKDYPLAALPSQNHYHQWVDACLGTGIPSANFDYAGPLTQLVLLGVVANRFPTQKLQWDAKRQTVTNFDPAAQMLRRTYREGWSVEGLG